ncbi:YdcF family protein [Legionella septentrionalis]|uniref:YdcF family protein n=1 Tax=Legionella septentrionalis TaxID=2498109 RepID=UPI001F299E0A|nr:YdcF family protein [Legionella septentrionalis]
MFEALLNPFFLVIFLLTVSWILFLRQANRRAGILLTIALASLLLLSTGIIPELLTRKLEDQYPVVTKINKDIHWIVVLSGGQAQFAKADVAINQIYTASLRRLIEGVRLYRQLPHAKLLLSGGEFAGELAEAQQLDLLAAWLQIPEDNRVLETASTNTASQAEKIRQWVRDEPFYLVTSALHMPRAIALCRKQGLHPIAAPTDFTYYWYDERWGKYYLPNPHNLVYLNQAWHEIAGRLWAYLHHKS